MITQTHALLYQLIEDAMAKPPTPYVKPKVRVKAKGIPMAGVIVKKIDVSTTMKGKFDPEKAVYKTVIVKKDTAPPHVRAGRRRKANKVTGARAAK